MPGATYLGRYIVVRRDASTLALRHSRIYVHSPHPPQLLQIQQRMTPTRLARCSEEGNGHFTMGPSQQGAAAPGCINFSRNGGNNRHKFNAKADSTALCSANFQCFCLGDCAPIAAHPNPNSVSTQPGTSGTGGNGGSDDRLTQGATEPSPSPLDRASSSVLGGPVVAGLAAAAMLGNIV